MGAVPSSWDVKALKFCADLVTERVDGSSDSGAAYVGLEHIESKTGRLVRAEGSQDSAESTVNRFQTGDVLFGKLRPYLAKAAVADLDGVCSSEILVYRPHGLAPQYLKHVLLLDGFIEEVNSSTYGSKMPRADASFISRLPVPQPPIKEQIAIASYLDAETKRIDGLIEEKRGLLELVEELRLSTIHDVITKGLRPNAPRTATGVPWIGDAPSHWTVMAIKRLSPVKRGASPRPIDDQRYFDEGGEYGWVRIEDVSRSDGILNETSQTLSELGSSLSVKLEPGALFLSIAGTVGKPCIAGRKVCIHDGFVYFPDLDIDSRYLFRLFESKLPFRGLGKMGTQLNLNTQTVGDIMIALPPAHEMNEIVLYLEEKLGEFHELRAHVEQEYLFLTEMRAATITDAVLGRIDVREQMPYMTAKSRTSQGSTS